MDSRLWDCVGDTRLAGRRALLLKYQNTTPAAVAAISGFATHRAISRPLGFGMRPQIFTKRLRLDLRQRKPNALFAALARLLEGCTVVAVKKRMLQKRRDNRQQHYGDQYPA